MLELNFTPFPILETERLVLRKIDANDVNEVFALRSDARVMKHIAKPLATSPDDAAKLIQLITDNITDNSGITWAIALKGNLKLIGTIGFWRIAKEHYRGEIGYMLSPDHQGKGIMQEAMNTALEYGFNKLKLHSVEANVDPNNTSSFKLLEKSKFIREAHFKEDYYYDGKFLDSFVYSLLTSVA